MKLKAATSDSMPEAAVEAMDKMRPLVLERALVPYLHVPPDFGPAEFYIQLTDKADGSTHALFVEARLSGVSVTRRRSTQDFYDARAALEAAYREILEAHLAVGTRVQLMVAIMLDQRPFDEESSLIEGTPSAVWVEGKKNDASIRQTDETALKVAAIFSQPRI